MDILSFKVSPCPLSHKSQRSFRNVAVFHRLLWDVYRRTTETSVSLLPCLVSLTSQQDVNLLLDPVFVVRLVRLGVRSVTGKKNKKATFKICRNANSHLKHLHKTAQVCQVVNEVKQLANIVCDGRAVGVHPLEMLFVHFAHTCEKAADV